MRSPRTPHSNTSPVSLPTSSPRSSSQVFRVDRFRDDAATFRRLIVAPADPKPSGRWSRSAVDHIARPAVHTEVGPSLSPLELGANKILAVYGREVARDYDDIAHLVPTLGWWAMLRLADEKSPTPLDRDILAASLEYSVHLPDDRFPIPATASTVKRYMQALATGLRGGPEPGNGPFENGRRDDATDNGLADP